MATKTVLVIEDHPGARDIYGHILWYNGFQVLFAADGEAGLKVARERRPDLVLLDLELPLLHGLELCSRLKQDDSTRGIPIVALTARRLEELGGNADVLGYAHFLEKPVRPLEVLRVVEEEIGLPSDDEAEYPFPPEVHSTAPVETPKGLDSEMGIADPSIPLAAPHRLQAQPYPRPDLSQIGDHLVCHVAEVIARWEKLGRAEPWFSLPTQDRVDNLPAVVEAFGRGLITADDHETQTNIVHQAVEHGISRRAHLVPKSAIPLEFHLLRQAIWRELTDAYPPGADVYAAIRTLDDWISSALNAAMWGYYREEIDAQGQWEAALERLGGSAGAPAEGS